MKKQRVVALTLLLLIPGVWRLEGWVFSRINPESAAGHPDYVRTYHFLSLLKHASFWVSGAIVVALWLLVCLLVIRSKQRSSWWLLLAAFGPFGFAILAMLRDRAPAPTDCHERFERNLNRFVRAAYQLSVFVIIWMLAYQAVVFKRDLMIRHQSATTGMSVAQIIDLQNASSGMWAFAEGNEEMYLVVLLYLIWPVLFNLLCKVGTRVAASTESSKIS
jgi:hypothetical protein